MVINNLKFLLTLSKPHCLLLTPLPLPLLPAVGWRGEFKAQNVKIMGKDKNNLLEMTVR